MNSETTLKFEDKQAVLKPPTQCFIKQPLKTFLKFSIPMTVYLNMSSHVHLGYRINKT